MKFYLRNKLLIKTLVLCGMGLSFQQALANAHVYVLVQNDTPHTVQISTVNSYNMNPYNGAAWTQIIAPGASGYFQYEDGGGVGSKNSFTLTGFNNGASLYYWHDGGDPSVVAPTVSVNQRTATQDCALGITPSWQFSVIQPNNYNRPIGACPAAFPNGASNNIALCVSGEGSSFPALSSQCDTDPGIHFGVEIPPDSTMATVPPA